MKFLLDTNVFREAGKVQRNANFAAWLAIVRDAGLAISTITVREVCKGIERIRTRKPDVAHQIELRTSRMFESLGDRILPISHAIAKLWGEWLAEREKHIDDTGLAATAVVHQLILVTRNVKDLSGRGVTLLDPFKSQPARDPRLDVGEL